MSEIASKLALRRETDRSPALRRLGWYHSFEFPDGSSIEGVQSMAQLRERWARFPLPPNLQGRRVLDIGAWDGWFSFEAERRGASVVAVDCVEIPNLVTAKQKLASSVDYRITDLYKIPRLELGAFDYVFFLGVLYHVKHPLLALELVCSLTGEIAIVESAVIDGPQYQAGMREEIPTLEFFETDELGGHLDNWFGPSVASMMAMCRAAGFARVELLSVTATTATVACFRHWPSPKEPLREPAPHLTAVTNNANLGINVSRDNDDYLQWWFASEEALTRHDLEFEVGGLGCHAVYLKKREGNGWSANTILPPGISQGWVEARVRTVNSPFTEGRRLAVDIPLAPASRLVLGDIQDGSTWEVGSISEAATHMTLWVHGLAANCDRANTVVLCDGEKLMVEFVGPEDGNGARQVNARIPEGLARGRSVSVLVRHADLESNSVVVRV